MIKFVFLLSNEKWEMKRFFITQVSTELAAPFRRAREFRGQLVGHRDRHEAEDLAARGDGGARVLRRDRLDFPGSGRPVAASA